MRLKKSAWIQQRSNAKGTTWVAAGLASPEQQAPEQLPVPERCPERPPSARLPVRLASLEQEEERGRQQAQLRQLQEIRAPVLQLQARQVSQASEELLHRALAVPEAFHPFRAAPAVRAGRQPQPTQHRKSNQTSAEFPDDQAHGPACRDFHTPVARG